MARLILTCGIFLFLCSVSISYAASGKPCGVENATSKKQACKTSDKIIPEKLLKIKPLDLKTAERPVLPTSRSAKTPSTANTFETLITPFLKVVAPHFYDQILKKQAKGSSNRS